MSWKSFACLAVAFLTAACEGSPHGLMEGPLGPSPAGATLAISSVGAAVVAPSAATITWVTDAESDSHVEFGPTEKYGATASADGLVKTHSVAITGLKPGTSYHFRVRSADQAGTLATSDNHTFKTPAEGESERHGNDRHGSDPDRGNSGGGASGGDSGGGSAGDAGGAGDAHPKVAIAEPDDAATLSGVVTVKAAANDDHGVASVQFKIDGTDVGRADDSKPYAVRWDTREVGDGTHNLTAIVRDSAGQTTTSAPVRVKVRNTSSSGSGGGSTSPSPDPEPSPEPPPPSGGGNWPNEPSGFRIRSDKSWDSVTGDGWSYRRRQSSKDADIVSDSSAPESRNSVLRMIFTTDMDRDSEPGVHWMTFGSNRPREIFTGWWMKLSSNWKASPAGGGKIAFLWPPDGEGQVYANIGGSGAPHRININTEWSPYGQKFWEPNIRTTSVTYDRWYRVEWYVRWESSPGAGDGIIRWWVNGQLNGDYRNVRFPDCCLQQFEFAPTLQNPPSSEQYMFIDHTYVSTP